MWIELTLRAYDNMSTWCFDKPDEYRNTVNAEENSGWKAAPLCVEAGAWGYVNDKWQNVVGALILDKENEQASPKCSLRRSGAVQVLLVRMFVASTVVHYNTAGLGSGETSQQQILQSAILIANRQQAPQERAGCMSTGYLVRVVVGT